jgi:hypothetical protein
MIPPIDHHPATPTPRKEETHSTLGEWNADVHCHDMRPTVLTSSDHTKELTIRNRTPQPNPSHRRARA